MAVGASGTFRECCGARLEWHSQSILSLAVARAEAAKHLLALVAIFQRHPAPRQTRASRRTRAAISSASSRPSRARRTSFDRPRAAERARAANVSGFLEFSNFFSSVMVFLSFSEVGSKAPERMRGVRSPKFGGNLENRYTYICTYRRSFYFSRKSFSSSWPLRDTP